MESGFRFNLILPYSYKFVILSEIKGADSSADVSVLEREIDALVADLYGLDDAERKLVGIG